MKFIKQIIIPLLTFIVILGIGISFYHSVEKWSYLDSTYFTVVTITTVGYGDLKPTTDLGKVFTIFFIFSGIFVSFYLLSSIGRYFFMRLIRERLIKEGRIKNKRGVIRAKR